MISKHYIYLSRAPSPEPCAVGMTAAMAAIGAGDVSSSQQKSPLQAKKEQILARLNSKPPADPASKPKVSNRDMLYCI